jgi:hypothetical protein
MLLGLIRRRHLLLGAGLLFLSQSFASAGFINFETLPSGDTPVEGLSVGDQFAAAFGVTFKMESGAGPLIAAIGGPRTAFQGYNDIEDMPDPSANAGQFFLTDDGIVGDPPPAMLIEYTTPVSAASAAILDIDQQEAWQIDARDQFGNIINTMILDTSSVGAGNGTAAYWFFSHASNDIYSIRISYVGATDRGVGLAFDNFWTDSINPSVISTPEPGSIALLGTGAVGMLIPVWRKRRKAAANSAKA